MLKHHNDYLLNRFCVFLHNGQLTIKCFLKFQVVLQGAVHVIPAQKIPLITLRLLGKVAVEIQV